jgi:tetratricopeptide (TPR) repeat protein
MKFFRKKKVLPDSRRQMTGVNPAHHFYSRSADETPLDDSFGRAGFRSQRTSRNTPVRRRETSNRAGSRTIFLLLFRSALIVVLLVVGFFALRWWLNGLSKPSEKEKQLWAANAARMEKLTVPVTVPEQTSAPDQVVNPALIRQRVEQWDMVEQNLRVADAFNHRGVDADAVRRMEQVLKVMPNNRAAKKMLVEIYMRNERYAEAVPLYIQLIDVDGLQQDLQMNLLDALQKSGQLDAALVLTDRMLLDQPHDLTLLLISANGQIAKGDPDAALALFERMLVVDAEHSEALKNCAEIYFSRQNYDRAILRYLDLLKLDPQLDYYNKTAICYAQQNELGKSVVMMGQAASLFGAAAVSPWLKDPAFDSIRESVEFRSFADRIVGVETRKAIEEINKRRVEETQPKIPGDVDVSKKPELKVIPKK